MSIDLRNLDADVRDAAVHVGQLHAQLGHAVYLRNALACEEVEAVEILSVGFDDYLAGGFGDRNDRSVSKA